MVFVFFGLKYLRWPPEQKWQHLHYAGLVSSSYDTSMGADSCFTAKWKVFFTFLSVIDTAVKSPR